MNIKVSILLLLAGALMGAGSPAFGQSKGLPDNNDPTLKASISGNVVLPSGHPVNNRVRIKLSTLNNFGMDLYTDNNGAFDYEGLLPGTYTLEVSQEDSHDGSAKEQVSLLAGERVTLMIYLKREGDTEKSAGSAATVEASKPVPPKAKQEYTTAVNLESMGDLTSAINHFNNALKIFPQYLDAHNDLGVVYLKLKRPDDAAAQFESAIEISPKSYNPRLNLGIILLGKRKFPEAVEQLTQCVSIDSSQASGHLYLGTALLGQDDLSAAKRELTAALDIGGAKFSVGHYYLAYMYMKSGDKNQAIRELETFLGSQPDDLQVASQARALLTRLKSP